MSFSFALIADVQHADKVQEYAPRIGPPDCCLACALQQINVCIAPPPPPAGFILTTSLDKFRTEQHTMVCRGSRMTRTLRGGGSICDPQRRSWSQRLTTGWSAKQS